MDFRKLRVVFAGNPHIAVGTLRSLAEACHVVAVITNPDRPAGRGRVLESPQVKTAALELGLPVFQYDRLLSQARTDIGALQPDVLVSFACGFYFGPKFLSLFPLAAVNIHPSLLPRYRGCSPIQYALLNGDDKTGITIQRISSEVDCGNVLACQEIELEGTETSDSLSEKVSEYAGPLVVSTLRQIFDGHVRELVQDGRQATYAPMIAKEDGQIDWSDSAKHLHAKIRALQHWPRAVTTWDKASLSVTAVYGPLSEAGVESVPTNTKPGTVLAFVKHKGLAIATGDGILYVSRLQPSMKREMDSAAFVNGHPKIIGSVLGT